MLKSVLALGVAFATLTSVSVAQNINANPRNGDTNLSAGFSAPHTVNVVAGGNIDASEVHDDCVGTISSTPDYRVDYDGDALRIGVHSEEDTTLVVHGPNGEWLCVDDFDGLNPFLDEPMGAGRYVIWVGTYEEDSQYQATLYFTETETPIEE